MTRRQFAQPLSVRVGEYVVEEIASLDDTFDLLNTWPQQKRNIAYWAALTACQRADANLMSLETLRENIRRFLKMAGVLEKDGAALLPDRKLRLKHKTGT